MPAIQQLRQLIQTALDNYDRDRGWLRRARPEDLLAKIIARLMNRQIGDPPSIHRLRKILRGLPADTDDQAIASPEQLWPLIDCLYNTQRAAPPSLTTTIIDQLQHDLSAKLSPHIAGALDNLQRDFRLNQRTVLRQLQHAKDIARAFKCLRQAGILTPENGETVLQHPEHAEHIALTFYHLQLANLLSQTNITPILQHPQQAQSISWAFGDLQRAGLLNQENVTSILQDLEHINGIPQVFMRLQMAGKLDQANVTFILQHSKDAVKLANAISALKQSQELNPETLARLLPEDALFRRFSEAVPPRRRFLSRVDIKTPSSSDGERAPFPDDDGHIQPAAPFV
ncbi:MAG: hypothetical protein A3C55_06045 [Gammaproteobacteria bacterium RIFCSPHIGHO2_02_FULL_42_13]|nr:MAG: hypothetical protein A3C55_06045 [Gammaproteobacteria bacterium RIFCSPHIGHO2_02_FULL_42_13]OGT69960.1 MAG: hypothetical protein A3H43_00055 [Gammaproteobacteria bacterium RIFCSPLOWO2_02_FULL_42_9]